MGTNKSKDKGSKFERDIVKILNDIIVGANFKRIPGSGAIGTIMGESMLTADVRGKVDNFPVDFKGECKVGYNSSTGKEVKQFTLKKEWLDKVWEQASGDYSLPVLFGKFDNARSGTKIFVVMDVDVFADLINRYTKVQRDLDTLQNKEVLDK
jgi:hypothetical protein